MRTVVFLYPFDLYDREELNSMTMKIREVNNIWSKVRDDVDVDDLIFKGEETNTREYEPCSDR